MQPKAKLTPVQSQFEELKTQSKHLCVLSTSGGRVVIKFAGVHEEFRFQGDRIERVTSDIPINSWDEANLRELAIRARKASIAGYNPNETRKKPRRITPSLVTNKRKTHSSIGLIKARQTMLYEICSAWRANDQTFTLESVTSNSCLMTYVGTPQRVSFDQARGKNWRESSNWIGIDYFCFVSLFGDQMIKAALDGYRSTNPPKRAVGLSPSEKEALLQTCFRF